MTYQTLYEFNRTGIDNILLYVVRNVPSFTVIFLLSLFLTVAISIYFGQRRRGTEDIFVAMTVASLVTVMATITMTLKDGLVTLPILVGVLTVFVIFLILMFMTRERD